MIITKIWKKLPGKYFCISTKDRFKKWEDHFFKKSEFNDIDEFVEENLDKDVYWCPHGFDKPRRLKKYAAIPKILWADLDEVDPRDLGSLTPTIAWESSPNRYAAIWEIDSFMTEDLNKALTYHLGADQGGWDLTQVLRVPGTKNYKYEDSPKVKLLWADGEVFDSAFIEKKLPKPKKEKPKDDGLDPKFIYRKYEKKFDSFVRRELLRGKPIPGKRSEVIWKLCHSLMEAGCSREEAFELLRVSPWNKFKERRDGDEQLRREIDKALDQHLNVSVNNSKTFHETEEESDDEDDEDEEYQYLSQSLANIEEEQIDWLWYPYLARGEMTILEGDPGLGKSYLAQMVAMHICDGKKLPSKKPKRSTGRIAYFDMENSPSTVTRKRLRCNAIEHLENFYQETMTFSINDEEALEGIDKALKKIRPSLVVFDTINSYMGNADTYKSSDVQQQLKYFVNIARRNNCAVLILRHLTKSNKEKSLYRGQGSIAFVGMARIVLTVGKHPEDDEIRVMATTKNNITAHPKSLGFSIRSLPDTLREEDRSLFVWGEVYDLNADQIVSVSTSTSDKKGERHDEVKEWLEKLLEEGPTDADKLLRAMESKGYTKNSVYRASEELEIKKTKNKRAQWIWELPSREN